MLSQCACPSDPGPPPPDAVACVGQVPEGTVDEDGADRPSDVGVAAAGSGIDRGSRDRPGRARRSRSGSSTAVVAAVTLAACVSGAVGTGAFFSPFVGVA